MDFAAFYFVEFLFAIPFMINLLNFICLEHCTHTQFVHVKVVIAALVLHTYTQSPSIMITYMVKKKYPIKCFVFAMMTQFVCL
jgi:hypothetical protein